MILFRYVVGLVVWILLIGVCLCSFFATIFLWLKWDELRRQNYTGNQAVERTKTYLAVAIVATLVTVIIWLVILVMRKRIKLVIELFREAGKAISYMPLLLFEPFLTFIALAVAISIWFYLALIIESSGELGSRGTGASMKVILQLSD
jgi:solute carrier family 44 protein 1 (choline transporter-like protein)